MSGLRSSQFQTLSREGASFSTFASHNPRIVCRGERVYLNFTECGADRTRRVRFMESKDGGRSYSTFDVLPAGDQDVRPVGMAISKEGDLLGIAPELNTADMERGRNWLLLRYAASAGGGARPVSVQLMGRHGTSNFSVHCDVRNNILYYAAIIDSSGIVRRPNLFAIDASTGKILFRRAVTRSVAFAGIHYPYLATSAGRLFLAWTSWSPAAKRYDGVCVMRSDDGGHNWLSLAGVRHRAPVDSRPQGPADGVVLPEDVGASTWLANMCVNGQALHFYYCARRESAERPCYRRYDLLANRWDHLIEPGWGGARLAINGLDGVFIPGLRLVAIGNQSGWWRSPPTTTVKHGPISPGFPWSLVASPMASTPAARDRTILWACLLLCLLRPETGHAQLWPFESSALMETDTTAWSPPQMIGPILAAMSCAPPYSKGLRFEA
jgi:hypothetical protein